MALEPVVEKWTSAVSSVTIGAGKEKGGTRSHTITVGGQKTLPFLFQEGAIPNPPVVALEIEDCVPSDWPKELEKYYAPVWNDPIKWAEFCVRECKAKLLCVRLQSTNPDSLNRSPEEAAGFISDLLKKVSVPLVIIGSGDDAKDNAVLPLCSEAARGQACLIGSAQQNNYKTITAAALADGHSLIAESPIDINIAKQLNILVSDMGLPLSRIVINPTIGALGYGLEYAYSIMERARLAALAGDKMMASPFICFTAQESWRVKEAKATKEEFPQWGDEIERGVYWELLTASALLHAGADILVMRHPKAVEKMNEYIDGLFVGNQETEKLKN